MEKEKVEVKVQEEEVEDGRDNEESKARVEERTHGWDDAHKQLSQCRVTHNNKCAL